MSGRYQPYPEYEDSGIEWLGDIPKTWSIVRMDDLAATIKDQVTSTDLRSTTVIHYSIPTVQELGIGSIEEGDTIDSSKFIVRTGDVLFSKLNPRKKTITTVARHEHMAVASTEFVVLRLTTPDQRYLQYLLHSQELSSFVCSQVESATKSHQRINPSVISKLKFTLPSQNERVRISNFLDHETAKIDTLIERQQQLIQLLKEKRQAVVNRAVTKGLNPCAKMRDSDVEWLGEVPAHWEVSKFGYISMVVRGGSPRPAGDPELFNGDYSPWVTVAEITKDDEIYLTQTETFLTKKGSDQCRIFSAGTLLISNSGATLGVPKILSIDANANDGVVGFENLELDHEFSYFYLSTLTDDLRERIKQGSGQPNLNTDIVKNIPVPIPPKNEVSEIVALIQDTRKHYANLMSKANAGIELLQERRTALISAAVTGKIDVRDWVASKANQTNKEVAA